MVPQSPFSFIYHITEVAPYRDEMHHDMRQALRRFSIDVEMMKERLAGDPEKARDAVHKASYGVERASFNERAPGKEPLRVPMEQATRNLFVGIVPLLAWELEHAPPGPDQPDPDRNTLFTLLNATYRLFYSSAYRGSAASEQPPEPDPQIPSGIVDWAKFKESWRFVRDALGRKPTERLRADKTTPHVKVLMEGLASEFTFAAWKICW